MIGSWIDVEFITSSRVYSLVNCERLKKVQVHQGCFFHLCDQITQFKSTITLLYLFIFIEYIVQHATTKTVPVSDTVLELDMIKI